MQRITALFSAASLFLFILILSNQAWACDLCACTLSRSGCSEGEKPWFFDFTFEQQNWDTMDARDAHQLHHQGHHVHNKTHEEFYHFTLGANPWDRVSIFAEIPYVVRESVEIHSHRRLGAKQISEGFGDLNLNGVWRFWQEEKGHVGMLGGVKFATGSTTEKDPDGARYEPELQPGSGSTDATVGGVFRYDLRPITLRGSAVYIFKTEGDQEFEYGDLFSTYLFIEYSLNWGQAFETRIGVDMNLQIEEKQIDHGMEMEDSGGTTFLIGPALTIMANDHVAIFGNFMLPAYQNLGGVHQELDFTWSAGAKIAW